MFIPPLPKQLVPVQKEASPPPSLLLATPRVLPENRVGLCGAARPLMPGVFFDFL